MRKEHESKQENPQPAANELIDITARLQAMKADVRYHEVSAMDDPVVVAYAELFNHIRKVAPKKRSASENNLSLHLHTLISLWPRYCEQSRDLILQMMLTAVESLTMTWANFFNIYFPSLIQQVKADSYVSQAALRHLSKITLLAFSKRKELTDKSQKLFFKRVCEVIFMSGWSVDDRLRILKDVQELLDNSDNMHSFVTHLKDYTGSDWLELLQYCDGIFDDWVRYFISRSRKSDSWLCDNFQSLLKSYCSLHNITGTNTEKIFLLLIENRLWQLMADSQHGSQNDNEATANYCYFMAHKNAPLLHDVFSELDTVNAVERLAALPSFFASFPKNFTQDFLDQAVDWFAVSSQMNQARVTEYILVDAYAKGYGYLVKKLSLQFGDPAKIDRVFAYNGLQEYEQSLALGLCHIKQWGVVQDVTQALSHFNKAHQAATSSSTTRPSKALVIEIQLHLMLQRFPDSTQEITNALVDCYVRRGQYAAALKIHLQYCGEIQPSAVSWLVQFSDSMAYDGEINLGDVVIAAEEAMQSDGEAKQEELLHAQYNKLSLLEACERLGNSGAAAWQALVNYYTNHPTSPNPHKAEHYRTQINNASERENRQQMLAGLPQAAFDIKTKGSWSDSVGLIRRRLHDSATLLLAAARLDDVEISLDALKKIAHLLLNHALPIERGARNAFIQLYNHLNDIPYDQGLNEIGAHMPSVLKAAIAEREKQVSASPVEPSAPEAAPAAIVQESKGEGSKVATTDVGEFSIVYEQTLRSMAHLTDLLKGGAQLTTARRESLQQQYTCLQQQLPSHSTSQPVADRVISPGEIEVPWISAFGLVTQAGRDAASALSQPAQVEGVVNDGPHLDPPPCV
ncbi:MAG: hypothetical protein P1U63_13430 [Coxiellaceae bacterium]|nr:hypothetical protein [Coxiellaceae bacterium]MDF1797528.1 hypothetical protein [Coxiellaceae bacterium]